METVMMFETTTIHTNENVSSRLPPRLAGSSIGGPGTRPWMMNAPSRMAMVTLPGTPKAMVGTSAPPRFELLAAPGPSTPSTAPLPKRSLSGELCTAWA